MRAKKYIFTTLCLTLLCCGAVGSALTAEPQAHTNSIGMEFVLIPAGSFISNAETIEGYEVTISNPFYLGKYEVTQEEWVAVMGRLPQDSCD